VGTEVPLKLFALNCCVPETLSKIVLGSVSSAVSTVTDDWDDEFAVPFVVSENPLEPIGKAKELLSRADLALKDSWFHLGSSEGATVNRLSLVEEATFWCISGQDVEWISVS